MGVAGLSFENKEKLTPLLYIKNKLKKDILEQGYEVVNL